MWPAPKHLPLQAGRLIDLSSDFDWRKPGPADRTDELLFHPPLQALAVEAVLARRDHCLVAAFNLAEADGALGARRDDTSRVVESDRLVPVWQEEGAAKRVLQEDDEDLRKNVNGRKNRHVR